MVSSSRLIWSETFFINASSEVASSPDFFMRAISSLALLRSAFRRSAEVITMRRSVSSRAKGRQIQRHAAVPRHLLDHIQVLAHISEVQHRPSRIHESGRK